MVKISKVNLDLNQSHLSDPFKVVDRESRLRLRGEKGSLKISEPSNNRHFNPAEYKFYLTTYIVTKADFQ